jgi:hypothetical protein
MEYQNKIIPVLKAMGSFQFPLWDTAVKGCIDEALKTFNSLLGYPHAWISALFSDIQAGLFI